jgi:hypothetical protein
MEPTDRVKERLQRAMEGLMREFEADGTQPVDCAFYVVMIGGRFDIGITNTVKDATFDGTGGYWNISKDVEYSDPFMGMPDERTEPEKSSKKTKPKLT